MSKALTTEQAEDLLVDAFVYEYVKDWNASRAYKEIINREAKDPRSRASKFLARDDVQDRLRTVMSETLEESKVGLKRVVEELGRIAFFNPDHYSDLSGTRPVLDLQKLMQDPEAMKAVSIKFKRVIDKDGGGHDIYELEQHSKLSALATLLKYHQAAAGLTPPGEGRAIQINVNFPVPGAHWQQPTAKDITDESSEIDRD